MLDNLVDAVVAALRDAGLTACGAYPHTAVPAQAGMVCVGISHAEDAEAGFARYLGVVTDAETGEREVYGMRCGVGVSLDMYVPMTEQDAPAACLAMFDRAADCVGSMAGFSLRKLHCGAPAPDQASGMMHLHAEAEGTALLIAADAPEQGGTFSKFVLRGELSI